jgi:hypothetical protein
LEVELGSTVVALELGTSIGFAVALAGRTRLVVGLAFTIGFAIRLTMGLVIGFLLELVSTTDGARTVLVSTEVAFAISG